MLGELRKEIVNTSAGPVFLRCSKPGPDEALLWLHDAGASSRSLESIARGLAGSRRVVLVDLPGHGETGILHLPDYSAERLAGLMAEVTGRLNIQAVSVVAHGAACAIAAAMFRMDIDAEVVRNLVLIDPWLFDHGERDRMAADYAPDLVPQAFGQHLLAAWYFARDSELFWPWNAPLAENALSRMPEISAAQTQARAVDAIKAGPEFRRLVHDLLAYDLSGDLAFMGSRGATKLRVTARRGNGHQARAERAADLAGASYAVLPECLDEWVPELNKCLG